MEDTKGQKIVYRYLLEIVVFICGAVVMIFELIGSRLIGPYVGASIYVWTSLIGVILASLSLGYYLGGRLADKNPQELFLGVVIILAAFFICLTAIFRDVGLFFSSGSLGLEIKSIILSIILFTPASFFLGMVSPYAVRLRINNLKTIGKEVGNLYALSTAGSIFGTFLAGFWLIPKFGSKDSLSLIALVLIITAILVFRKKIFKNLPVIIMLLIVVLSLFFSYFSKPKFHNLLSADIDTKYDRVWVYKGVDYATGKPTVNLSTDPFGIQASVFSDQTDDLVLDYTKFFRLIGYFNPETKNALMIGGCTYTYPRDFMKNFPQAHMDIVEIDPAMTEIAQKYFYFKNSPFFTIFNQDGRMFLNENKKKYDAIINDAFDSAPSVPFQLTTVEAVQKEFNALNDNGVVLSNIVSAVNGRQGEFFRAEYATYKKIFPQVFVFLVSNRANPMELQNIMLVASKSEKDFDFKTTDEKLTGYLSHLWKEPIAMDLPILTDDFAPVEDYQGKLLKSITSLDWNHYF